MLHVKMNREELCHLHTLLHMVHEYAEYADQDTIPLPRYSELEKLPGAPKAAFLQKKPVVENAVQLLLTDIVEHIESPETQSTPKPATAVMQVPSNSHELLSS